MAINICGFVYLRAFFVVSIPKQYFSYSAIYDFVSILSLCLLSLPVSKFTIRHDKWTMGNIDLNTSILSSFIATYMHQHLVIIWMI